MKAKESVLLEETGYTLLWIVVGGEGYIASGWLSSQSAASWNRSMFDESRYTWGGDTSVC